MKEIGLKIRQNLIVEMYFDCILVAAEPYALCLMSGERIVAEHFCPACCAYFCKGRSF